MRLNIRSLLNNWNGNGCSHIYHRSSCQAVIVGLNTPCYMCSFLFQHWHTFTLQSLLGFAVVRQSNINTDTHALAYIHTHTYTHSGDGLCSGLCTDRRRLVCSVSGWRFEASLCSSSKIQTSSVRLDVTWYLHIIYIYLYIYILKYKYISVLSQGILLYATRTLRVDLKLLFEDAWNIVCDVLMQHHQGSWPWGMVFFYKIPLNSHSEINKSSPLKAVFSAL